MSRILLGAVMATLAAGTALAGSTPTTKGELKLYEMKNFNGDFESVTKPRAAMRTDWNVASIGVYPGDKWQLCAKPRWQEPCLIVTESVADSAEIGIEGQVASIRPAP